MSAKPTSEARADIAERKPFAWAVTDCNRKPMAGPYYDEADARRAADNFLKYGNPARVGYVQRLYVGESATPTAQPQAVKFGLSSYSDSRFELIVRNDETGEETTLRGKMDEGQFTVVDRILPSCVLTPVQPAAATESLLNPFEVVAAVRAARAVVSHWNEFGPAHGFEEVVDRLAQYMPKALAAPPHPAAPADAGDAMRVAQIIEDVIEGRFPGTPINKGSSAIMMLEEALAAARRLLDAPPGVGERMREQIEHLKDVLHRDQTGLAHALAEVVKTAEGFNWASQNRGPYEWDDPEFYKEMGRMLEAILKIARDGLTASGNLAHRECCGRNALAAPAPAESSNNPA